MTEADLSAVFNAVDANASGAVSLLRELIGHQKSGEDAVQAEVRERLAALGGDVRVVRYRPRDVSLVDEFATAEASDAGEREAVVATCRGAGAGGRSLLLFAHPDAEPTAGAADWTVPAFDGVLLGDRLHGWGVADDLAGVAIGLSALSALQHAGVRIAGDVVMASTPSKRHARGIAAVLQQGYVADAALYLHPAESGAGLHEIKAMTSGQLEFTLTVAGKRPQTNEPGHTAFSHLAVNPLDQALLLVQALRRLADERARRVRHPLLEAEVGRATNIMLSSLQFGGAVLSQLPETLTIGGALSFPPGEDMRDIQAEMRAAIDAVVAGDAFMSAHPPTLQWVSGVSASEVPASHPFYQVVAGAVEASCGFAPRVNAMHTSSDIRNPLVQKGIPTLGLGPLCGDLTHAGGTNEWVSCADYIRAIKVAAATIVNWCGVAR